MTNNEKVSRILDRIVSIVKLYSECLEREGLSSAEWIYWKAKREAALDILKDVENIANRK